MALAARAAALSWGMGGDYPLPGHHACSSGGGDLDHSAVLLAPSASAYWTDGKWGCQANRKCHGTRGTSVGHESWSGTPEPFQGQEREAFSSHARWLLSCTLNLAKGGL